ncbi:hypothetical protein [Saccharopolyspora sp. CA-218241]|uniref:hypothetical protein n=1 Tax=Saccharopolyspora sp. CA-218241 TaxID=3240027 RepID=UPI003D954CBB
MAGEVTTPMLPCGSIDEIEDFYSMLGFSRTYRRLRPNPYLVVRLEDVDLHFYGLADFDPAGSHSSCLVSVPDVVALFDSFAAGMRAAHGKLLVTGIPRMTRPRKRKNSGGRTGFSVVDPAGNTIRFFPARQRTTTGTDPTSRLGTALENAIVLGDSKGDERQAAKIPDGALCREQESASPVELVEALAYRAELAVRLDDTSGVDAALARIEATGLTAADREGLGDALVIAHDLGRSR